MKLAYIIPAFGENNYTNQILLDLLAQDRSDDIFVIDNKGDYEESTEVIEAYRQSRSNLDILEGNEQRWLKGTNFGTKIASQVGATYGSYGAYVWLNNDTRVSPEFSQGIVDALDNLGDLCGILAPSYNDVWPQQNMGYHGSALNYTTPIVEEREVKFVDGACMVIPAKVWDKLGPMDERFWKFGWGGDFDYCIRARAEGYGIWVTGRAYFNHLGGGTNKLLEENYFGEAGSEMHTGMLEKYGPGWEELIK